MNMNISNIHPEAVKYYYHTGGRTCFEHFATTDKNNKVNCLWVHMRKSGWERYTNDELNEYERKLVPGSVELKKDDFLAALFVNLL